MVNVLLLINYNKLIINWTIVWLAYEDYTVFIKIISYLKILKKLIL